MIKFATTCLFLLLFHNGIYAQNLVLKPGININKSVRIKKAVYDFSKNSSAAKPAVIIEGNNITIDFSQATLIGNTDITHPDIYQGIAVQVQNSRKVTIKNLTAKGYKLALLARNVEELVIENCDFSYNYRPRLQSSQQKEDVSDWLSYHQNEKDEWLRYGAGVYLSQCSKAVVRNCRITGNQNALLMTGCSNGLIYNNDFSFNSGLGIGMYRCSGNRIAYNRLIFNIRGYSHGVYQRGQDSAGILAFEQCNGNLFYKNNVTHSGDGFFLWAGQSTMESGSGGCNDNLLLENDFSYAATNGIELTFSRNTVSGNRIFECENGIWGGYSFNTIIRNNRFRNNKTAIAIEHGQENSISYNLFDQDKQAIRLWANEKQPADWGYVQHRDTRSRGYNIVSNSFNRNSTVFNFSRTSGLHVFSNTFSGYDQLFRMDNTVTDLDTTMYYEILEQVEKDTSISLPEIISPADPFKGTGNWAGRKNIRMTEWGPYDFRYPLIWNSNPADTSAWMEFELLGPKGKWTVKNKKGIDSLSATKGGFPAKLRAKRTANGRGARDIQLELEYTGEAITSPFGEKIPKGRRHPFRFTQFFQPLDWEVLWFKMDTAYYNPLHETGLFAPTVRMAPVKRDTADQLDYAWWNGLKAGENVYDQFITMAGSRTPLPAGDYELSVTWQDAVRVYVGDQIVLNEWKVLPKGADSAPNRRIKLHLTSNQYIRVDHLGFSGFSALGIKLLPVR